VAALRVLAERYAFGELLARLGPPVDDDVLDDGDADPVEARA
jgi:hypothetical protein